MKGLRQAVLVFAGVWMFLPLELPAQSPPAAQAADSATIERGQEWFYQRCSLCHLGRVLKNETHEPMAPTLNGVLKDASAAREAAVREQIAEGSLRMPGFRHGLTAQEFEELMAYLKTL